MVRLRARSCEICGSRAAMYVCQGCGQQVCESCFNAGLWLCSNCERKTAQIVPALPPIATGWQLPLGLWIFFLSFAAIFIGMLMLMIGAMTRVGPSVSGGGVIFIGPLPILIGFGPSWDLSLIVGLTAILIALTLFLFFLKRK